MLFIRLTLLLSFFSTASYAGDEVALTFDDLPGVGISGNVTGFSISKSILNTLKKHNAPSIAFVNEGKFANNELYFDGLKTLRAWIARGHPLGNHTYSHLAFSKTDIEVFKTDTLKGSIISKNLMRHTNMRYKYFRYPYLDTGKTPQLNAAFEFFLDKKGYIPAPVTFDTYDWAFNSALLSNPQDKDKIIAEYLKFVTAYFPFIEDASTKLFGRNIKHIWLMHANLLNSLVLDKVLKIAEARGYTFTTLDRVLKDPAYQQRADVVRYGDNLIYSLDVVKKAIDWSLYPSSPYTDHL